MTNRMILRCRAVCLLVLPACYSPSSSPSSGGDTDQLDSTTIADPTSSATSSGMGTSESPTITETSGSSDVVETSAGTVDGGTSESGSSTGGEPACDLLADDCADGTLCDGSACVDPVEGSVAVPGGPFMMGCNADADPACGDDEYPYHEVTLSSFSIDQTEVTVGAWQTCVDAGACAPLPATDGAGNPCDYSADDHPAFCLDWFQASDFCTWRGGLLPTEAQWEKAARGADGRVYPWGDASPTCTLAHYSACDEFTRTLPVGSKPAGASPYGALDMTGNVSEWVADWYSASYYLMSPSENPPGPDSGTRKLARSSGPNYEAARCSSRGFDFDVAAPDDFHVNVGFRCAYPPPY